jgi:hypothetical protein
MAFTCAECGQRTECDSAHCAVIVTPDWRPISWRAPCLNCYRWHYGAPSTAVLDLLGAANVRACLESDDMCYPGWFVLPSEVQPPFATIDVVEFIVELDEVDLGEVLASWADHLDPRGER